jgi:hypothetical protein
MGRATQIRLRRRFLHRDETEVRKLERELAKIRVNAESRATKRRVTELTRLITEKRAAIGEFMTADQIANAVLRSRRWVTNSAPHIPGARFTKNKHVFLKSIALMEWLKSQRRISELDRKLIAGNRRLSQPSTSEAFRALSRCERDIRRCLVFHPFDEWDPVSREAFVRDFNRLIKGVYQAIQ